MPTSDEDRFAELQQSVLYDRDQDVSSVRNYLIDQYENVASQTPEDYTGNIYSDVLPSSATESNYSAAARYTARDPVNNRTRWALQGALLQYGIEYGYDELTTRAEGSTEFSYQIHRQAFRFSNNVRTIGRLPWSLLTHFDVPRIGEQIGDILYAPEAFLEGTLAGLNQLALDPYSPGRANADFDSAYARTISQKYDVGGRFINWTIETTNSPYGFSSLPWYGQGIRVDLEIRSFVTYPLYD